jgi:hypothetical protein
MPVAARDLSDNMALQREVGMQSENKAFNFEQNGWGVHA